WAAFSGIVAAALAEHGASGPATVLEGRFGVLAAHADELDAEALTADLGTRWETLEIAFKPYPSCHCGHAVLDAVTVCEVEAGEVEEVVALAPGEVAIGLVLEPAAEKLRPRTPYDAKFSLPYCIAALLLRGELGLDAFTDEAIADPRALELAARVGYEEVDFPGGSELSGGVRIRTAAGTREERVTQPRGAPGNPLDPAAVEAKFRRNAAPALGDEGAERLREVVGALERCDAAELASALAPRGTGR
ncbi:MAG TPA: hypothetical protein VEB65_12775, partial [Solirubrobacterales bacterium]|nr:hypothetical protein [Solirubrobacterales bacterium]